MTDFLNEIAACVPGSAAEEIDWQRIEGMPAFSFFPKMRRTQQNPVYHGEGNVYIHTKMVCGELNRLPGFHALAPRQKTEVFLAALLHDIGKIQTTRLEDGRWRSPHHASVGSVMARALLWRDCGLCGTPERMAFREAVCALVRYHMLPVRLLEKEDPGRRARAVAAIGELAPDFTWQLLCLLSEADVRGRIAGDTAEELEQIDLSRLLAGESQCLNAPFAFADAHTRRAYLSGRRVQPDLPLYDESWGEVILLSGLPGTGKDTWIRRNHPDLPVVSLDRLRKALGIKPTDHQGEVVQAAKEQAKEYLRQKQPFIWNATNLTRETRQKVTGLMERYGARVRIVHLETGWADRMARNAGRKDAVPEDAVERMLGKTELPVPKEAQAVEWVCV